MSGDRPSVAPELGSAQRWCFDLVSGTELRAKLDPGTPSELWQQGLPAMRLEGPGRPPELRVSARSPKTPKPAALNTVKPWRVEERQGKEEVS